MITHSSIALSVVGLLTLASAAGCADVTESATDTNDDRAAPPIGQTSQAIISGAAATDGNVGLVFFSTNYVCSGFLVSPNVVITAAFCFNGGKTPTAFFTGAGSAVASPADVPTAANLTRFEVQTSGMFPGAITQAAESGLDGYTAQNDIAFVVLTTNATTTPITYSSTATPGACSSEGYGRISNVFGEGTLGQLKKGSVTLTGGLAGTDALDVTGSGLANSGDFGGPLLCNGNAVGLFSAFQYNESNQIIENAYQPITATIKTWIDGLVTANPPTTVTTTGADGGADGGSLATQGTGSQATSGSTSKSSTSSSDSSDDDDDDSSNSNNGSSSNTLPKTNSGCATQQLPASSSSFGVFATLALFVVARLRRRR